jgi:hypothetical protein
MSIRNFNLQRSQVKKWGTIGLNQSLIQTHTHTHKHTHTHTQTHTHTNTHTQTHTHKHTQQTHTHARALPLLLMKSLFTWTHTYPTDGYIPLQWQEFQVYSLDLYLPTTYTY